jgi:hypothetical protein
MYIDAGATSFVFTYDNFGAGFPVGAHDMSGSFMFQIQ